MSYKVIGEITRIKEKQTFDSGAGKIEFRIDTGEQWNNILEFELFKGAEYVQHLDNFSKFNKVGDRVEVEFNLKSNHYTKDGNDKIYTSLSCWKVEKVGFKETPTAPKQEPAPTKEIEDLPF